MYFISQIKKQPKTINLKNDILAGIIVALVSIPISMGYAQIAGLPVVYGLYGSILPILVFAFLTTSPQFVVGVDAMPAAMMGTLLATMGVKSGSKDAMAIVACMSFVVAIWFVIFYILKAGRIVKYISTPVMGGFISGVGTTIIFMQIPKLFGGTAGTGEIFVLIGHTIKQLNMFNTASFILGIGTITVIMVGKKVVPKVPIIVIMMVVGVVLEMTLHLEKYGVKMLPEVIIEMPRFALPDVMLVKENIADIMVQSFSIAGVVMAQTLLASGNYALRYNYKIDNNRELLAYAGMNVAGGVVGCCPINGSVSRSGIADNFKCKSQLMSVVASLTMLIVVAFGTPILKYLPVPVLTGIVITALMGIIEVSLASRLWKTSKNEWLIFQLSFFSVLVFGTVYGVMIGCVLSFAAVAIRSVAPVTSFMGRIPGQGNFYPLDRNSSARPIKNTVIYKFNGNLFFANIDRFQSDIENAIKEDTNQVIVDARGLINVDITAVDRLVVFSNNLKEKGIRFYITEHVGVINDQIRILGGECLLEQGVMRRTITLALRDAGVKKPYNLEGEDDEDVISVYAESAERLAEFEWAFGADAEMRLDMLADKMAEKLVETKNLYSEHIQLLEEHGVKTEWGIIGLFDENEFWDHLEMRLEKMVSRGRITQEQATRLEEMIEKRRTEGEDRLKELNPKALELMHEHRKEIRAHLKKQIPEGYAHVHNLRKQLREKMDNK